MFPETSHESEPSELFVGEHLTLSELEILWYPCQTPLCLRRRVLGVAGCSEESAGAVGDVSVLPLFRSVTSVRSHVLQGARREIPPAPRASRLRGP